MEEEEIRKWRILQKKRKLTLKLNKVSVVAEHKRLLKK